MAIDPHQALMAALKTPTQQQVAMQALFTQPPPTQYQQPVGQILPLPNISRPSPVMPITR